MFKNFRFKLFVKLFVTYICVFLIPLIVFGSVLTSYTMKNYRQEILDMNIKITEYICKLVDESFQDATVANLQIMENDVISDFMTNTNISPQEMAFYSKQVSMEIQKYKSYRNAINSIDIYTATHGYIITDSSYCTKEEYYAKNFSDSGYSFEQIERIFNGEIESSLILIPSYNTDNYSHTATIIKPLAVRDEKIVALCLVVINMDYISDVYRSMLSEKYKPCLCMVYDGEIISGASSIPKKVSIDKIDLDDGNSQSVNGYIASVRKSSVFDLKYVSFLAEDAVLETVNKNNIVLLILLMFGSLILALSAVAFSNKTFQPVKGFIATDGSNENSFNSVDEIHNFIINTINSNKRLSNVVSKQEKCINDNFYKLFIQNSMSVDENLISAIFADTPISMNSKWFRAAIVDLKPHGTFRDKVVEVNTIPYFSEVLKNNNIDFFVIPNDGSQMILILSFFSIDSLKFAFDRLINILQNKEEIDMTVCLGRAVNSIFKFTKSYEDAFFAHLDSPEGVVCYDGGSNISYDSYFAFIKKDKLIFDVSTGNSKEVKNFFNELRYIIFVKNISTYGIQNYVRYLINGIFDDVIKIAKMSEIQVKKYSAACRSALENQSVAESFDCFEKLFITITDVIAKGTSPKSNEDVVDEIIKYVHNNYSSPDISLKMISEELGATSYKYVSEAFKRKTGSKFTDYLHNVRIEKAKELLLETDLLVFEIANRVGYLSDNVFIRSFKKSVGITPGEFRQSRQ